MNIKLKFTSVIIVSLLSGCTSMSKSFDNVIAKKDVASEVTTGQVEPGFWKNSNLDYVAEDIPSGAKPLSIRDIPYLESAFIDIAPRDRNDRLVMGELGIDGSDKGMIVKLAHEIADGQHGKIASLLIAHKGKLVFESYFLNGRVNLTLPQASATKTYTGMALGRAIQLGYLTMADLDKPLVSFLKQLDPTKFIEGAQRVTLHQALTMRSGIRISKEQREVFDKYPKQVKGQRLVQAILQRSTPITSESQSSFSYGNYSSPLVMQVIDAVVPGTAEDFIKDELLGKMDISTYGWQIGLGGLPAAGWKSSITSRAMMKFGILVMNKGKWNGEQLIPEAYITTSTSRILNTNNDVKVFGGGKDVSNQGYGYFWWNADMKVGDKRYASVSAQGGGGQFIILIEELDLIVVATGHERHPSTLQVTAERILPAFTKDEFPVLDGPYLGQKPPALTPQVFAPGIVSIDGRYEGAISFSPDLDEIYFTANNKNEKSAIHFSKLKGNRWTPIEKADFTKGKKDEEIHPFVSPNGKRVYFTALSSDLSDTAIWYVNRLDHSWSDAVKLDLPIDGDLAFFPIQANNRGLYYFNISKMKTYYAAYRNGGFPEAKEVEIEPGFHHVFISPHQDYLILNGQNKEDEARNDNDLYVSFKEHDETWTKPINLGDTVNSKVNEKNPSITPDGKYLFFGRDEDDGKANVYWVSTEIITELKTTYFKQ